jgi:hypothetical protein
VNDAAGATLKPETDSSDGVLLTSCQFVGGVSVKLPSVLAVGEIVNVSVACCPGAMPGDVSEVSPVMFPTTCAGAASAAVANGIEATSASATRPVVIRVLRTFKVIHPLVVAVYIREVRRTPDQKTHHPPFGLWRQQQGASPNGLKNG